MSNVLTTYINYWYAPCLVARAQLFLWACVFAVACMRALHMHDNNNNNNNNNIIFIIGPETEHIFGKTPYISNNYQIF